jgi:hypothetical protein
MGEGLAIMPISIGFPARTNSFTSVRVLETSAINVGLPCVDDAARTT